MPLRTLLRGDGGAGRARQKDQKDKLEKAPLCSHRSPLPANADRAATLDSRFNLVGDLGVRDGRKFITISSGWLNSCKRRSARAQMHAPTGETNCARRTRGATIAVQW